MAEALLEVKDLAVNYGHVAAVKGIDLRIEKGAITTLVGANGAGKSTSLLAISGLVKKARGQVIFDGVDISRESPHRIVQRGLVQVAEGRATLTTLTVKENLELGAYTRKISKAERDREIDAIYELFPRLKERQKQLAGTLSGGEQQMVAMARAIISQPKLLLLDEPSMGLAPLIVEKIFEIIQMVAKEGVTMLLVEQNAKLALEVSQRGYVMESGRITMSGPAQELLADERVRNAYLGE